MPDRLTADDLLACRTGLLDIDAVRDTREREALERIWPSHGQPSDAEARAWFAEQNAELSALALCRLDEAPIWNPRGVFASDLGAPRLRPQRLEVSNLGVRPWPPDAAAVKAR